MSAASSDMYKLPPHLEAMASDEAWWKRLLATPEDRLEPDQLEMFSALNVQPPPQQRVRQ